MGWNPLSRKHQDDGAEGQLRMLSRLAREDLLELGERLEDEVPPAEAVLAVQETICQAFVHLARSDAIVRGEEPPTRSDPCAFNPQHGPAVTEAVWAPIGGTSTTYACCQPDADLIAAGKAPRRRTIKLEVGDVAWDELGSARRTPNDLRRADATDDYLAVAVAAQRTAAGMQHFGGRI